MSALISWLRRLYSLDTLDTRLTASSTTSLRAAADSRRTPAERDARANAIASRASPPRWHTPEFFVYYLFFIVCVPLMFKTVVDVSQESHPTYKTYSHLLSDGWIFGRKVDNSDAQYASFRDNIPYLLVLLILHPLLHRIYDTLVSGTDGTAGDARLRRQIRFDFYFGLVFIVVLHGVSAVKILGIMYVNYRIARGLPQRFVPAATWTFNIAILFANELCSGYPLERIVLLFTPPVTESLQEPAIILWARWLDSLGGLMPRWEVLFKFAVLRHISFNMDYHWSLNYTAASPIEKKQLDPSSLSERDRVSIPAEPAAYNGRNYLAYALYAPLYLSGPIVTFNDYISQRRYASPSLTRTRTTLYGIRFFLTLLCMELMLHYIYAVAISKASPNWSMYSTGQLSMLAYFNLHIIWLKLLIPWRFFRLWALVDGIDPPENMVRCMSNNYSTLAFWRSWHRSYNRWIVRYVYIPLGGAGRPSKSSGDKSSSSSSSSSTATIRKVFNFFVVFTFVALWHDINLRLLMWGWLISFFVLPEILGQMLFPASKWRNRPTAYRVLCGVGAVANVFMMMVANLVGFALGLDGLKGLLAGALGSWAGIAFLLTTCVVLFVGVQTMFEIREEERRNGIDLKC
ncbi:hypothetical protein ASPZODRAFT_13249 [Penicilliopsis zonata CBS 506.65]|uniref:Uncharacterized protein n=1 Tax=Penicilliopsis zonata CBS 506.65 TaxID=1073090 RepID=A0A1L9SSK5_9EURO|nr:hypothetical protein ASPZODRAFT_13249 [Penicilliopsis zonata CBS 506.65]OJJ50159.1 hypothetical protein ASPZODRAFT_13249 [Penicilliopsis zonata CBS 506.65]